ncbi:MAG: phasin family protein [Candidatus Methanoperedenaceae archaeon]|nr:phasin family protein [Candidatus Methanoperedenaceae archaeon]MDW7725529.1 phasin family protein [Candidatus Methanoperedens sp.]
MSEMSDILRKMGLFGVGLISLTKDKVEELSQEMVKKGEISQEEGKKFVQEVLSEKEQQLKHLEKQVNDKVKDFINKSGVVTRKDIQALEKKIDELEKKLQ